MLELIVLGQVPGTKIVITFSWAVALLTMLSGVSMLRRIRNQRITSNLVHIEETTI